MLATPDGGRTWTPITQLNACLTQCGAGAEQVTDIRFASPAIGYLYDSFASSPLMMTTDDGHRWSVEPGRATVALDVSGGQATRVSASGTGCPGPGRWSIDEAALGSNAWSTVDVSAQLARQGSASYTLFPGNLASGAGSHRPTSTSPKPAVPSGHINLIPAVPRATTRTTPRRSRLRPIEC